MLWLNSLEVVQYAEILTSELRLSLQQSDKRS